MLRCVLVATALVVLASAGPLAPAQKKANDWEPVHAHKAAIHHGKLFDEYSILPSPRSLPIDASKIAMNESDVV